MNQNTTYKFVMLSQDHKIISNNNLPVFTMDDIMIETRDYDARVLSIEDILIERINAKLRKYDEQVWNAPLIASDVIRYDNKKDKLKVLKDYWNQLFKPTKYLSARAAHFGPDWENAGAGEKFLRTYRTLGFLKEKEEFDFSAIDEIVPKGYVYREDKPARQLFLLQLNSPRSIYPLAIKKFKDSNLMMVLGYNWR